MEKPKFINKFTNPMTGKKRVTFLRNFVQLTGPRLKQMTLILPMKCFTNSLTPSIMNAYVRVKRVRTDRNYKSWLSKALLKSVRTRTSFVEIALKINLRK